MSDTQYQPSLLQTKTKKRSKFRWLKITGLSVLVLIVLASSVAYGYVYHSLPQTRGELQLSGLNQTVTVYRDQWGVPHIEASTRHDLYFAQGYVTAQDRLWQMDVTRRLASGTTAEIMGASAVNSDKLFRLLKLRKSAEESLPLYSQSVRNDLDSFAAGINAYIKEAIDHHKLQPEFALLGYEPDLWTAVDTLTVGKYLAYDLGENFKTEAFRYQLEQVVGANKVQEIIPEYPKSAPVTVTKNAITDPSAPPVTPSLESRKDTVADVDLKSLFAMADFGSQDSFVGSNGWVVSGKKTASGKPILANDPHLEIQTPSVWYQIHLVLNGDSKMNVTGVSVPGVPGVLVGHNDQIAWGITNTMADAQDFFIEKRNPQNPLQFEYQGKWEEAKVDKQVIKVKNGSDVPFDVISSRNGPILSDVIGPQDKHPQDALALKWTAMEPSTDLESFLQIDKSQNWNDFQNAIQELKAPALNFLFASTEGTIAYHTGGSIPIRAKGDGTVPVPGWSGQYDWKGYIPFEKLPTTVNPSEGYIVSANNKITDDTYPYLITKNWATSYRAQRIVDVLKDKNGLNSDDMRNLQTDVTEVQAQKLLPLFLKIADKQQDLAADEKTVIELLRNWNYQDTSDSAAAYAYQMWWWEICKEIFQPKMGDYLFDRMFLKGNITDDMILNAANGQSCTWVQEAGGLERLVRDGLKKAVNDGQKQLNKDPEKWHWGDYHKVGPLHPIGADVAPLGWLFNAKKYSIGGSNLTIGLMAFDYKTGLVTDSAPWRQVVDLSNIADNSKDVLITGQSGHFLSKWYLDQQQLHVNGALHPQLFSPNSYQTGDKLVLQP